MDDEFKKLNDGFESFWRDSVDLLKANCPAHYQYLMGYSMDALRGMALGEHVRRQSETRDLANGLLNSLEIKGTVH